MSEHKKCLLYYQNQHNQGEIWAHNPLHSRNSHFPLEHVLGGTNVINSFFCGTKRKPDTVFEALYVFLVLESENQIQLFIPYRLFIQLL